MALIRGLPAAEPVNAGGLPVAERVQAGVFLSLKGFTLVSSKEQVELKEFRPQRTYVKANSPPILKQLGNKQKRSFEFLPPPKAYPWSSYR